MKRKLTRPWTAAVASLTLVLALAASPVRAEIGAPSVQSASTLFRYAGCAFAIAAAPSGFGLAAAIAMCLHVLVTEA